MMLSIQYTDKNKATRPLSNWLLSVFAITVLSSFMNIAQANESPKALLESIAKKMITALNENRAEIKADSNVTQRIIEKNLLPHIDIIGGSKAVLGHHWDKASTDQKRGFLRAFRKLLLNFYSSALTEYLNNQEGDLDINIMEFIDPGTITSRQITVRSYVKAKSGKAVPINYEMNNNPRKGWQIFDVSVQGVSVITTYKSSYAAEIEKKGIDQLIKTIESHNRKLRSTESS